MSLLGCTGNSHIQHRTVDLRSCASKSYKTLNIPKWVDIVGMPHPECVGVPSGGCIALWRFHKKERG